MSERCCASVYRAGMFRPGRCSMNASLEYEGKTYCKLHYPPAVDVKRKARDDRWEAEYKAKDEAVKAAVRHRTLAEKALDYMRNEHPDVVEGWENE